MVCFKYAPKNSNIASNSQTKSKMTWGKIVKKV